jgi:hypothetical protein
MKWRTLAHVPRTQWRCSSFAGMTTPKSERAEASADRTGVYVVAAEDTR